MKIAGFLVEFDKIVKLPSKEKKGAVDEFLNKYTNILSAEERESLQRCLKAFNLPFNGDQNIVLNQAPFYEQTPPATFGAHFNKDLYQKAYALASFVYLFEKNGIP